MSNEIRLSNGEEVVEVELYERLLEECDRLSKENHELKCRLSNLEQLIIKLMCERKE